MDTQVQEITAKIVGYRQLSEDEQRLINEIKALGQQLEGKCEEIGSHLRTQAMHANDEERRRLAVAQPQWWASIAKTDFQTGLMALVRAVAQPLTF